MGGQQNFKYELYLYWPHLIIIYVIDLIIIIIIIINVAFCLINIKIEKKNLHVIEFGK